MPGGDRTGPAGYGPLTGRRAGYCAGYQVPGYMNGPVYGRGAGYGRGFGRGPGRGFGRLYDRAPGYNHPYTAPAYYEAEISKDDELEYMKETARALERELDHIRKQISKLRGNE
ncbi:MAG: DUF5320 domain-containing protein [Halanaerobiales bacterium]